MLDKIRGIPVIVIRAKTSPDDKANLLIRGAEDYLTKPFHTRELLARITVQLRKPKPQDAEVLRCRDVEVDTTSHLVTVGGKELPLTKTEYAILKLLIRNAGQVIAKSVILDRIGEDTPDCTESSLKTHMSHLRAKLRGAGDREYIEAIWGIGFRFSDKGEES